MHPPVNGSQLHCSHGSWRNANGESIPDSWTPRTQGFSVSCLYHLRGKDLLRRWVSNQCPLSVFGGFSPIGELKVRVHSRQIHEILSVCLLIFILLGVVIPFLRKWKKGESSLIMIPWSESACVDHRLRFSLNNLYTRDNLSHLLSLNHERWDWKLISRPW